MRTFHSLRNIENIESDLIQIFFQRNIDILIRMKRGKSTWHQKMQDYFPKEYQEIKFTLHHWSEDDTYTKKARIADVHKDETVIEYQHSRIVAEEVNSRNADYGKFEKQIVWIIDCTENTKQPIRISNQDEEEVWLLDFEKKWHVDAMIDCKILFAHFGDRMFRIPIQSVRKRMVTVYGSWLLNDAFITYLTSEIQTEIDIPLQSVLTVAQDPHGSGKTYRLTRMMIYTETEEYQEYEKYAAFIIITKPHSAKEVVYTEFSKHLHDAGLEILSKHENGGKYIVKFRRRTGTHIMCIFGTADSLMYNITDNKMKGTDMFIDLVRTIHQFGPTKLTGPKGRFRYAGENPLLNNKTLVITDEATMLPEPYADALSTLMETCSVDVHLAGDVQQSTYYEKNLLAKVVEEYNNNPGCESIPSFPTSKIRMNPGIEVRRFNQNLVDFRNTVMKGFHENPSHNLKIKVPIAAHDVQHNRGEYDIHLIERIKALDDADSENIQDSIDQIMGKFKEDVDKYMLLPNDIIMITPFVKNNTLMDEVQTRIHEFWVLRFNNPGYITSMQQINGFDEIMQHYESMKESNMLPWFCVLHRSEEGKPIDTNESKYGTRIVSIHASQGDGRKLAYVVGLNEWTLKRFSHKINIVYESLLNVSISRMKEHIRVFLEPTYDDIWERFIPFVPHEMQYKVPPALDAKKKFELMDADISNTLNKSDTFYNKIKSSVMNDYVLNIDNKNPLVDYGHHVIRMAVANTLIWAKLVVQQKKDNNYREQVLHIFTKVARAQVKSLKSKEYYIEIKKEKCIPVLYYDTGETSFKSTHTRIIQILMNVQSHVNSWLNGEEPVLRNLRPDEMVVLQYAVEVFKLAKYGLEDVKMDDVYNVVKCYMHMNDESNTKLEQHYEYLNQVELMYNAVIENMKEDWQWKIYRHINLGNKVNGLATRYFTLRTTISHLIVSDTIAMPVVLVPDVNEMNIAKVCTYAVLYTLVCLQPEQTKPAEDKGIPTWEYVLNKTIKICFLPLKGSRPIFVDVMKSVDENIELVSDWLGDYVHEQTHRDIPQAIKIAQHYRDDFEKAQELVYDAYKKNKCPEYIHTAFSDCDSHEDVEDILNEKLNRHLKMFKSDVKKR